MSNSCDYNCEGRHFFGAFLLGRTFCMVMEKSIRKDIPEKVIDISGIELTPGEPDVCLGSGDRGFECCCDECDYYLLCFPEFDIKSPLT